MFDTQIKELAAKLVTDCTKQGLRVVTAESCTGGLVGAAITEIPGSSAMYERGFTVYANEAKVSNLGVPPTLIHRHGAVSAEVALAMASGALLHSACDLSVATTGIAGPSGGSEGKPVGLVYVAYGTRGKPADVMEYHFEGERSNIRRQAVVAALNALNGLVSA